jgi:mannan endo-1,6-alpha-mannosidase
MRLQSLPRLGWNALWTILFFSSLAQAIDVNINDDRMSLFAIRFPGLTH